MPDDLRLVDATNCFPIEAETENGLSPVRLPVVNAVLFTAVVVSNFDAGDRLRNHFALPETQTKNARLYFEMAVGVSRVGRPPRSPQVHRNVIGQGAATRRDRSRDGSGDEEQAHDAS